MDGASNASCAEASAAPGQQMVEASGGESCSPGGLSPALADGNEPGSVAHRIWQDPDIVLLIFLRLKKDFDSIDALSRVNRFFRSLSSTPALYTFVVDGSGCGDYLTLTEALAQTRKGDKILVAPGVYAEELCIKKSVELVAQNARLPPVIVGEKRCVIKVEAAARVRVEGFVLRQHGAQACVYIMGQSYTEIVDCDITSGAAACINIGKLAKVFVRRNRIHHSQNTGIFAYNGAFGEITENLIYANKFPGISITTKAQLIIRSNFIFGNYQNGVHVYEKGQAIIEDNQIFMNSYPGIACKNSYNVVISRNRVFRNKQNGLHIFNQSSVYVDSNVIFDNLYSGVSVKTGANPLLSRNILFGNGEPGIFILQHGRGVVEGNYIFENSQDGVLVKTGGHPLVKNNFIYRNGDDAITQRDGGGGSFLCNDGETAKYTAAGLRADMADVLQQCERLLDESCGAGVATGSEGATANGN